MLRAGTGSVASQVKAMAERMPEKTVPNARLLSHPLSSGRDESSLDLEEKSKGGF